MFVFFKKYCVVFFFGYMSILCGGGYIIIIMLHIAGV